MAPVLARLPADTPGARSTPCQCRGAAGGRKRSHHVASQGEACWGWVLSSGAPWPLQVRGAGTPQPEPRCFRGSPASSLRSLHGPRMARGPERPPEVDPEGSDLVRAPLHSLAQHQVGRRRSGAKNLEQHSQTFVESMSEQRGLWGRGALQ